MNDFAIAGSLGAELRRITGCDYYGPYEWGMGGHRIDVEAGPVLISVYVECGYIELQWNEGKREDLPETVNCMALLGFANRLGAEDFYNYLKTGKEY